MGAVLLVQLLAQDSKGFGGNFRLPVEHVYLPAAGISLSLGMPALNVVCGKHHSSTLATAE